MYLDYEVKIPDSRHGITRKTIRGITYIYYAYDRKYSADKHYTIPKNTTIGKCLDASAETMYPNTNFLKYFPEAVLPETREIADRSACLRIGAFIVIRKVIAEYHLDEIIGRLIGKEAGLFLDLAAYSIVTENNAGQYYPDYAYNHPLFTQGMKLYSDSKVSSFINSITRDQCIAFQNEWNNRHDHREKIYITYDSTNKNCQVGDLECVEIGHPKDDDGKPVLNYSIAYDHNNSEPLYYEEYSGSIVDVSQLQQMLEKAKGYGYRQVGFILDRGYFSKENIHFMDKNGYEFIIMMKGMKSLVRDLVLSVKGSFEEKREFSLRDYKVNGLTVEHQLYPSDEKKRYFHIFYNEWKQTSERENVEEKIDRMALYLREHQGMKLNLSKEFGRYFDLIFYHEGQDDEKFMYGRERYEVIDEEISLCGYFVIITSEKLSAADALDLYKSRDASEELFREDKTFLGDRTMRCQTNEALHAKIFIEFVALIIRNRMHFLLKEQMLKTHHKENYMTVPAAIHELEKIEIVRHIDREYSMDYAVTATQKSILKAFDLAEPNVRKQAAGINEDLKSYNMKEVLNNVLSGSERS